MDQLLHKVCYTRNQARFYLWQNKLQQKHSKLPEYYDRDRLKIFYLQFKFLLTIQISEHSPILAQNTRIYQKNSH